MKTLTIEQCRAALVASALAIWAHVVKDEDAGQEATPEKIAEIFRVCDWQFWLDAHGDGEGGYTETYTVELPNGELETRYNEWCGLFIGAAGLQLGGYVPGVDACLDVSFRLGVAKYVLPSTLRMNDSAKWSKHKLAAPEHPDPSDLVPGDIITVGRGSAGSHLALVTHAPNRGGYLQTVEGNSRGRLGDDSSGEGVIVRNRSIHEIKRTYRLTADHFKGSVAP